MLIKNEIDNILYYMKMLYPYYFLKTMKEYIGLHYLLHTMKNYQKT